MIFKIRVVLDTEEDVIRTLLIDSTETLENLHKTIANVFGFNGQEMASFYRADKEWNQGEEIPLFSMDESPEASYMGNTMIHQNIQSIEEKLIYVYDYFEMWTFYCELIEIFENVEDKLPKLILSIGETPESAPEKEFIADSKAQNSYEYDDDLDDDFNDGFSDFENVDDLDTDIF